MDIAAFLQGVSLFAGVDAEDIAALAPTISERICGAGEVLFRAGERTDAFYVIGRGRLEVGVEEGGGWVHYYWLGAGEAVGIVSFFGRSEHRTTARAAEDSVVLEVGKESLPQLNQIPELLLAVFRERTQRMRVLVEMEEDLSLLSRDDLQQETDSLRRLLEELEDQSTALHNEIHMTQIKLQLCEARLGEDSRSGG